REREETAGPAKMDLQVPLAAGNLRVQSGAIPGTTIEVRARVAAELNATPAQFLYLVPGEGKEAFGSGCQIMVKLQLGFNRLRRYKRRHACAGLVGHSTQSNEIVAIPVVEGEHHGRGAYTP